MNSQYLAIFKKSEELGLPVEYRDDLTVHDRKELEDSNPDTFVWQVRKWGTHIYQPKRYRNTPNVQDIWIKDNDESLHTFVYENGELREVTVEEAKQFLSDKAREIGRVPVPEMTLKWCVPTVTEFTGSIPPHLRDIMTTEQRQRLVDIYQQEVHSFLEYARYAKQPDVFLAVFEQVKQGSVDAYFYVQDLGKEFDPDKVNLHLQNTSRVVYNGCILISANGDVSGHH